MPSNTFPSSTLVLTSLQDPNTPSLLDIRPYLQYVSDAPTADILNQIQQAFDNIQQTLRGSAPSLQQISIGSADIEDLTVSGQFGPGAFQVLNGPPNFDQIGWIGSQPSATSVNITSISSLGLVTTAAPHVLKPGDNVFIEDTSDANNTGFYVVDTTPLSTTFTVVGGISGGASTGGDMTKQFQGEWIKSFAAGGTGFPDAPLVIDVDGSLSINNAIILLTGPSGTLELDPSVPDFIATNTSGGYISITPGTFEASADATGYPNVIINSGSVNISEVAHHLVVNLGSGSGPVGYGTLNMVDPTTFQALTVNTSNATQILLLSGGDMNISGGVYRVSGNQVVKARMSAVPTPIGGVTVDVQARTAIAGILAVLSFASGGHGLTA
jgi:hypothetical protein